MTHSPFDKCEAARKALEQASDDFFRMMEAKPNHSRFNVFRSNNDVKIKVEQQLRQGAVRGLDGVKDLIEGMTDEWKKNHGKVGNFSVEKLCRIWSQHILEEHREYDICWQVIDFSSFHHNVSDIWKPQNSLESCTEPEHVRGRAFWGFIDDCGSKCSLQDPFVAPFPPHPLKKISLSTSWVTVTPNLIV